MRKKLCASLSCVAFSSSIRWTAFFLKVSCDVSKLYWYYLFGGLDFMWVSLGASVFWFYHIGCIFRCKMLRVLTKFFWFLLYDELPFLLPYVELSWVIFLGCKLPRVLSWRCPWCNGYRRRIWTRPHEFKSWTRLIAFHITLIPLGKVWIQLFSLQLWVNSRTDWVLQPWWGN